MPKLKTKRSAAKRVRMTATGKLVAGGGWKQHHLQLKSPKRKRRLRRNYTLSAADQKRMRLLVPYL
jgi:large subunit ribosomal protein L35